MLISLVSFKGSPGVTTATLGLAAAWPRPVIALDLDPFGGDMLAALAGGRAPASGHSLLDVLVDSRGRGFAEALGRHALRPVEHGPLMLAGLGSQDQARAVDWALVAQQASRLPGVDVIADCGRFTNGHPITAVLASSRLVVAVTRSDLRGARSAARGTPALIENVSPEAVRLIVFDPDQPYSALELSRACAVDVVGTMPHDPVSARFWSDGQPPGTRFHRRSLQRAFTESAKNLADEAHNEVVPR